MSNQLQSLEVFETYTNKKINVTVGMDCNVYFRHRSQWGKVVKITDGWKGTVYVNIYTHGLDDILKFDTICHLRTPDAWHNARARFFTPDEKLALQEKERIERERIRMANALQAVVNWQLFTVEQLKSVYDSAVASDIFKTNIDKLIPA